MRETSLGPKIHLFWAKNDPKVRQKAKRIYINVQKRIFLENSEENWNWKGIGSYAQKPSRNSEKTKHL